MRAEDELVTIAAVYSQSEFGLLMALLHQHGIFATAVGERHALVEWPLVVALGGIRVRIRRGDVPLARELVSAVDRTPYHGPVYSESRLLDIILMLLLFFFAAPPPPRVATAFWLGRLERPTEL